MECSVCKGVHPITVCEPSKRATVNDESQQRNTIYDFLFKRKPSSMAFFFERIPSSPRVWFETLSTVAQNKRRQNPPVDKFHPTHPTQGTAEDTQQAGISTCATCGEIEEANNVRITATVALSTIPVILEETYGIRIKANAFLDRGSVSSYLREEVADTLGQEAEPCYSIGG